MVYLRSGLAEKGENTQFTYVWKGRAAFLIATFGGAGLSPKAPGTAGSILALLPFLWIGTLHWAFQLAAILLLLMLGIWASGRMEMQTGIHDDQRIVVDEAVGIWITLFAFQPTLLPMVAGLALFRWMDIWKPFPANWIDRKWKGPKGVMFDDVVAGIYAHILLRALERLVTFL